MEGDNNNQNYDVEKEDAEANQNNEQNEMRENDEQDEENNEQNEDEESELMYIYEWVDSIELSRPKKNIARDFSDGVLLADIIKSYFPGLVDLHNYPSCSNTKHKESNWNVLNNKVLKKLGIKLSKKEINDIIRCEHLAIEHFLQKVYNSLGSKINMNKIKSNSNSDIQNNNNDMLRKVLQDKDNVIKQLHDIIEVLELKLKNSEDMEKIMEDKVEKLTQELNKNNKND